MDRWGIWEDFGVPIVLATLFGAGAWARAWVRRIRARRALAEVQMDATRRALDGVRQALWALHRPDDDTDEEMQERLAVTRHEIDEVRERLWVATGHKSRRPALGREDLDAVVRAIKRTQPVRIGSGPEDEHR